MQVVILAGGFGTRISEESILKPKPMIEIGGIPILIHIMRYFYKFGFDEFIICTGYKSEYIKQYFLNYQYNNSDLIIDYKDKKNIEIINNKSEKWKITIIDSGLNAQTGYRIKSISKYINENAFIMTYGDGLSNVDIDKLIAQHKKSNLIATLTAVNISSKFGALSIDNSNKITNFEEKTSNGGGFINAGYMVLNKKIFDYIPDDLTCSFEFDVLPKIAKMHELDCYKHNGFWKCMDTLKDKNELEEIWKQGNAPWK